MLSHARARPRVVLLDGASVSGFGAIVGCLGLASRSEGRWLLLAVLAGREHLGRLLSAATLRQFTIVLDYGEAVQIALHRIMAAVSCLLCGVPDTATAGLLFGALLGGLLNRQRLVGADYLAAALFLVERCVLVGLVNGLLVLLMLARLLVLLDGGHGFGSLGVMDDFLARVWLVLIAQEFIVFGVSVVSRVCVDAL